MATGHRALARREASLRAAGRGVTLEQAGLTRPCPSDVPPCPGADSFPRRKSSVSHDELTSHSPSRAVPFWLSPRAGKLVSGGTRRLHTTMPHFAGPLGTWGTGPILIAASHGHSRARQTRPPRMASGVRRPRVRRGHRRSPVSVGRFSFPLVPSGQTPARRCQAGLRRAPGGISPVST